MYITDFELEIDEKILLRGEKYFADGLVADMWSEIPNNYHAVVEGSIHYDVEIRLGQDGEILRHSCDCPYDWGEYCKHETAVLFAIRTHLKQGTSLKQQGHKQGLRALLQRQSNDVLVDLLCDLSAEYDLRENIFFRLKDGLET